MRRRPCRKQLPELNLLMKSDTRSARSTSTALTMLPYVRLCMGATSSISVQTDAQRLTRNPACWLIPPDAASCGFNGGAVTTKIANGFSITTTASEFHRTGEVIRAMRRHGAPTPQSPCVATSVVLLGAVVTPDWPWNILRGDFPFDFAAGTDSPELVCRFDRKASLGQRIPHHSRLHTDRR